MSNEKRLVLFLVLTFVSIWGIQFLMDVTGLNPPLPKKPQPPIAQANPPADAKAVPKPTGPAAPETPRPEAAAIKKDDGKDQEKGPAVEPPKARPEKVAPVDPARLVLGSAADRTPDGYRLEVHLEQEGAGVASVASSRFEAEQVEGAKRHLPLQLLRRDPKAPPSLALTLLTPKKERGSPASEAAEAGTTAVPERPKSGTRPTRSWTRRTTSSGRSSATNKAEWSGRSRRLRPAPRARSMGRGSSFARAWNRSASS